MPRLLLLLLACLPSVTWADSQNDFNISRPHVNQRQRRDDWRTNPEIRSELLPQEGADFVFEDKQREFNKIQTRINADGIEDEVIGTEQCASNFVNQATRRYPAESGHEIFTAVTAFSAELSPSGKRVLGAIHSIASNVDYPSLPENKIERFVDGKLDELPSTISYYTHSGPRDIGLFFDCGKQTVQLLYRCYEEIKPVIKHGKMELAVHQVEETYLANDPIIDPQTGEEIPWRFRESFCVPPK